MREGVVPTERVLIDAIRVEGRHRRDLGDLTSLAESMKVQQINPVTITPDGRLLAGARRIAAARLLGWRHIDARVVETLDDATKALLIERDENTERKAMTPSELVSLGQALEALERPKARARQASKEPARSSPSAGGTSSDEGESKRRAHEGETNQVVADALGIGRSTYEQAKHVVKAATDPARTPEERSEAAQAVADMDAGKASITGSYLRVRKKGTPPSAVSRKARVDGAAKQRRAIAKADASLSGICYGLEQIRALHEDITSEEAARWVGSLSESRRVLTALINLLKERSK